MENATREMERMTETGPILANTVCPICGDACKVPLPETAGNYAFTCVWVHAGGDLGESCVGYRTDGNAA